MPSTSMNCENCPLNDIPRPHSDAEQMELHIRTARLVGYYAGTKSVPAIANPSEALHAKKCWNEIESGDCQLFEVNSKKAAKKPFKLRKPESS